MHKGLYQCQRLPYRVTSAPAIWQRAMDKVLQGIPEVSCYLDDISFVTGRSTGEHLTNLETVLQRLQANGLNLNEVIFFKTLLSIAGTSFLHPVKEESEVTRCCTNVQANGHYSTPIFPGHDKILC